MAATVKSRFPKTIDKPMLMLLWDLDEFALFVIPAVVSLFIILLSTATSFYSSFLVISTFKTLLNTPSFIASNSAMSCEKAFE